MKTNCLKRTKGVRTSNSLKKLFCIILAVSILVIPMSVVNADTSVPVVDVSGSYTLFGDLNTDGVVDSIDYAYMKMLLLGTGDTSKINVKAADLNGDNSVNALDYSILGKFLEGSIRTFPVKNAFPSTPDGASFNVDLNSTFQISLEENGSTGYQWSYSDSDLDSVNLVSEDYYTFTPNLVGTPSQKVWTFQALEPGKHTLTFSYTRPWETGVPPLYTVQCDIYVSTIDETVIDVNQNDTFKISLIEGGLAGYSWSYTLSDKSGIALLSKERIDHNPGSFDSFFQAIWTFQALKPGNYTVVFNEFSNHKSPVECEINVK